MDYIQLVKKSIVCAWKYRFLWFFGFFVAITESFGGLQLWDERIERFHRFESFRRFHYWGWDIDPVLLIILALLALWLWIVFWVMSVISEGSLIHGISMKETGRHTNFSDCWSAGIKNFPRLFGIILLVTLSAVFIIFGSLLFIVPAYILSAPLGILLTILILPAIFAIIILAFSVEGWAIRYAVLNNDPWLEAIKKGWHLFKNNIWKTVAIALLSFFTQMVLWCFIVVGVIMLSIPFIVMAFVDLWLGLTPGIMVVMVVVILSSAYFGTFASAIWTLGFMDLTKNLVPQPVAAGGETP